MEYVVSEIYKLPGVKAVYRNGELIHWYEDRREQNGAKKEEHYFMIPYYESKDEVV